MCGLGSVVGTGLTSKPATLLCWHLLSILERQTRKTCLVQQGKRLRNQIETIKLFAGKKKKVRKMNLGGRQSFFWVNDGAETQMKEDSKPCGLRNVFIAV